MINTLIFDLDGTLLNTLEDLKESTNAALKEFGYPQRTLDEIRNFVGNGVEKLIERAIPDGKMNPDFEDCLKYFKNHYKKNMYNHTAPYEGILEMLGAAKKRAFKTAVVSNKFDAAVKELCERYFGGYIDSAIGESKNVNKKPAPSRDFEAIRQLSANQNECVYIGDSDVDVQTAQNANLPCISVTWGFRTKDFLKEHGGVIFVDKPCEILEIVHNLK